MFSVCSSSKNCPSARCASAANVVYRDVDIFGTKPLSLKHILQFSTLMFVIYCINICISMFSIFVFVVCMCLFCMSTSLCLY
jgi:hypothetical protein